MAPSQPSPAELAWLAHLRDSYGELVAGEPLRRLTGFSDADALSKAAGAGKTPVRFFKLPGRRTWFALSCDLARFLAGIGAEPPR